MHGGAQKGFGIDYVAHAARLFMSVNKAKGRSAAALFVDVSSAFYSVIRGLAMPTQELSDEHTAFVLKSLNIGPEATQVLQQQLKEEGTILEQAGMNQHLTALVAEFHEEAHFFTAGMEKPVQTFKGTRPGVPLADIIYGFVMAHIMEKSPHSCNLQASHPQSLLMATKTSLPTRLQPQSTR